MCVLRDALPSDVAVERIELSLDTIVKLLKFIFKWFLDDPVEVYEKSSHINAKRKVFCEDIYPDMVRAMVIHGASSKAKNWCMVLSKEMKANATDDKDTIRRWKKRCHCRASGIKGEYPNVGRTGKNITMPKPKEIKETIRRW